MRYHITDDGPKECTAEEGHCPVAKADPTTTHGEYDTPQQVAQAYEERMETKRSSFGSLKKVAKRATLSPDEKKAFAKAKKEFDSNRLSGMLEQSTATTVATLGNEKMLSQLAGTTTIWSPEKPNSLSNYRLTPALQTGWTRSEGNHELRQAFEKNRQFTYPEMNNERARDVLDNHTGREYDHLRVQVASSLTVSEELRKEAQQKIDSPNMHVAILANPSAPLDTRVRSFEAMGGGRMPDDVAQEVFNHVDEYPINTPVAQQAVMQLSATSNNTDELDAIVERSKKLDGSSADVVSINVMRNEAASEKAKHIVARNNLVAESYAKIQDSQKELGDLAVERVTKGSTVTYKFNRADLMRRNLTYGDVDTYVRHIRNDNLNMGKYDSETGTYTGYTN